MNWLRVQDEILPLRITLQLEDGEQVQLVEQQQEDVDFTILEEFNNEAKVLEEEMAASSMSPLAAMLFVSF